MSRHKDPQEVLNSLNHHITLESVIASLYRRAKRTKWTAIAVHPHRDLMSLTMVGTAHNLTEILRYIESRKHTNTPAQTTLPPHLPIEAYEGEEPAHNVLRSATTIHTDSMLDERARIKSQL